MALPRVQSDDKVVASAGTPGRERDIPGRPLARVRKIRKVWVGISWSLLTPGRNTFPLQSTRLSQLLVFGNTKKWRLLFVAKLYPTLTRGLQHARPPCPLLSPGVCSNLCTLSWWHLPTISSSAAPSSSCPHSLPASESYSNESALCIRWPKYWSFSFSISPSEERTNSTPGISTGERRHEPNSATLG